MIFFEQRKSVFNISTTFSSVKVAESRNKVFYLLLQNFEIKFKTIKRAKKFKKIIANYAKFYADYKPRHGFKSLLQSINMSSFASIDEYSVF